MFAPLKQVSVSVSGGAKEPVMTFGGSQVMQ